MYMYNVTFEFHTTSGHVGKYILLCEVYYESLRILYERKWFVNWQLVGNLWIYEILYLFLFLSPFVTQNLAWCLKKCSNPRVAVQNERSSYPFYKSLITLTQPRHTQLAPRAGNSTVTSQEMSSTIIHSITLLQNPIMFTTVLTSPTQASGNVTLISVHFYHFSSDPEAILSTCTPVGSIRFHF